MRKRILSVLLALVLTLFLTGTAFAAPAAAQPQETALTHSVKISSPQDLLRFAESCRIDSFSRNLEVSLEQDIDLTGVDFKGIPVFCGTFRGNNHTISGLSLTGEGSVQGLFRYLTKTAVVESLTVKGPVTPVGSRSTVGGIAGENAGQILICGFSGNVSGAEQVGGLVGRNTVSGLIEGCRVLGEVYGDHFVGGAAGENAGVIRRCTNRAKINTAPQQNEVELSDITIESLTDSESANTVTDIGGIAGTSTGVIRGCKNAGDVGYRHMGYNIGGIAGTQSGTVIDCENSGNVQGRKEVGGIVGQMEPASRIIFEEDTLQILERQLNALSGTVNQTVSSVQTGAQEVRGEVNELKHHVDAAGDAVETLTDEVGTYVEELGKIDWSELLPEPELPQLPGEGEEPDIDLDLPEADLGGIELPDSDRLIAASNGLSSSLSRMTASLWDINETTQSAFGSLSNDLYRVQDQLDAMRATLGNAAETTGGSVADVSDQDTPEDLTGKVQSCLNRGSVLADVNAGGIAGAMAMENDLDPEDDWDIVGDNSLNFESELRAVILSCRNEGTVTVRRQNGGGIAGWQSLGLVKDCLNTGTADCGGAQYVGGIVGQASGFVRHNHVKCRVRGAALVGGIAGSASTVTDCHAIVLIEDAVEKAGAILGQRQQTDREEPIKENYYLAVDADHGAIDGISYEGLAQSLTRLQFFALDDTPEEMRTVTVRFVYESGAERRIYLRPGDDLLYSQIPSIPQREGHNAYWEGLDEANLVDVTFDMTFHAVYADYDGVLQSDLCDDAGRPVLLVQGSFSPAARLTVSPSAVSPQLSEKQSLLQSWSVQLSEGEKAEKVRLQKPSQEENAALLLFTAAADGSWQQTDYTVSGSYLIFAPAGNNSIIALVSEREAPLLPAVLAAAAGALVLLILAGQLMRRKKKKPASAKAE
ncbi:MAG: hypothetical protein IKK98_03785 [Oscillospiraceae bacterium]|nr:hypothetical protein [Oscillospiraceae bacterium]